MPELICKKTMQACMTPGMCLPHGGCQPSILKQTNVTYSQNSRPHTSESAKGLLARAALAEHKCEDMADIIRQVINDLPQRRDWLDPVLERRMKEAVDSVEFLSRKAKSIDVS